MKITCATYDDAAAMVAICASNLVNHKNNEELQKAKNFGFLITKLTEDSAKQMIDDKSNHITLVCKDDDGVAIGYLTACDIVYENSEYQKKVAQIVANHYPQHQGSKIIYYKQIAKLFSKSADRPIGQQLVLAMIDEAKKRGYPIISCRIVHSPARNLRSIAFHEKMGFKLYDSIVDSREIELGIYVLDISL